MAASNIKRMNRLELLYTCVANPVKEAVVLVRLVPELQKVLQIYMGLKSYTPNTVMA